MLLNFEETINYVSYVDAQVEKTVLSLFVKSYNFIHKAILRTSLSIKLLYFKLEKS